MCVYNKYIHMYGVRKGFFCGVERAALAQPFWPLIDNEGLSAENLRSLSSRMFAACLL